MTNSASGVSTHSKFVEGQSHALKLCCVARAGEVALSMKFSNHEIVMDMALRRQQKLL